MQINEVRRIQKSGASLVVSIPKIVRCYMGLEEKDNILFVLQDGKIVIEKL